MKQVFFDRDVGAGDILSLEDSVAHHLFDVLRTTSKERIRVVSNGHVYLARVLEKPQIEIVEEIESSSASTQPELTLCAAMIKADKFEWMLQKAAELGVNRIVPFTSERTVVSIEPKKIGRKMERWASILEQACRQSNRTDLVKLEVPCTLKDHGQYTADVSICAWEKEDEHRILYDELSSPFSSASFVIGPEGGLSEKEALYLEQAGFALCSLGSNILRAETAACFVLSAAQYQAQANA